MNGFCFTTNCFTFSDTCWYIHTSRLHKNRGKKLLINFLTGDDKNWLFLSLDTVVLLGLLLLLLLLRTASALVILLYIWLAFVLICRHSVCVDRSVCVCVFELQSIHFITDIVRSRFMTWNAEFQFYQQHTLTHTINLFPIINGGKIDYGILFVVFVFRVVWPGIGQQFGHAFRWYWTIFRNVDVRDDLV